MTEQELIAAQDRQRTARSFISFLGGAFGNDQSMANEDSQAVNYPGNYQIVNNQGFGVEGKPISTLQNGGLAISGNMLFLLLAAGAFFLLKD